MWFGRGAGDFNVGVAGGENVRELFAPEALCAAKDAVRLVAE